MVGSVTGGVIKYGRTVKTGDYENKRADAEISFSVPEGEDATETIALAGTLAHVHVYRILEIPHTGNMTATEILAARHPLPAEIVSYTAVVPPKRGPGAPRKTTAASLIPAVAASLAAEPPAVAAAKPTQAVAAGVSAAEISDADFPDTKPAEINDKELQAACQVTAARLKGNQAIRELRDVYLKAAGVIGPPQVILIPQAARAAFVKELATLKA